MRVLLIALLLLTQGLAVADPSIGDGGGGDNAAKAPGTVIYRTTDADGNVVFTDNPPQDRPAKAVHLKPTNSMPMGASGGQEASPSEKKRRQKPEVPGYSELRIISPGDGDTLRNPQKLTVSVRLVPSLLPEDRLRILDNGVPLQGTTLDNPDRGTHTLQAEVVSKDNQVLIRSDSITVYIHRTTVGQQGGGGGGSGSGVASFGSAAGTGNAASTGEAAPAGSSAPVGGTASFGSAASPAAPRVPAK